MNEQDKEAPLPYIRTKDEFKQESVEFLFDKEKESTITKVKTDADGKKTGEEIEKTTTKSRYTVDLKTYGQSTKEDREHFFEAFDRLQKALVPEWKQAQRSMTTDCPVLFDAIDEMLIGTASQNWHDVLDGETDTTWQTFKGKVAMFICQKVLPQDAYNRQVSYMAERSKPMSLTAQEWWDLFQTVNRYLPFMIPNTTKLKEEVQGVTFPDWWVKGSLTEAAQRRENRGGYN